ncbi:hypothetical protein CMO89_03490 [Candidatus Woesearchaeota archaeon]|nr:hypothetical protein [Candidatus Woesearchaeota archaeon]|tara:strand:- start:4161 stop:4595 length:435 start_codon:yes stop_codon:yes gene_type:complete
MKIIKHPDERLKTKCKEVSKINLSVKKEANELFLALKSIDSPFKIVNGLAANQIGLNKRIVILKKTGRFITMINPEIVSSVIPFLSIEICASLPKVIRIKKRKLIIKVKYLGLDNKIHKITLFGLSSFTMQQEIGHLNGKLIIN